MPGKASATVQIDVDFNTKIALKSVLSNVVIETATCNLNVSKLMQNSNHTAIFGCLGNAEHARLDWNRM